MRKSPRDPPKPRAFCGILKKQPRRLGSLLAPYRPSLAPVRFLSPDVDATETLARRSEKGHSGTPAPTAPLTGPPNTAFDHADVVNSVDVASADVASADVASPGVASAGVASANVANAPTVVSVVDADATAGDAVAGELNAPTVSAAVSV